LYNLYHLLEARKASFPVRPRRLKKIIPPDLKRIMGRNGKQPDLGGKWTIVFEGKKGAPIFPSKTWKILEREGKGKRSGKGQEPEKDREAQHEEGGKSELIAKTFPFCGRFDSNLKGGKERIEGKGHSSRLEKPVFVKIKKEGGENIKGGDNPSFQKDRIMCWKKSSQGGRGAIGRNQGNFCPRKQRQTERGSADEAVLSCQTPRKKKGLRGKGNARVLTS